MNEMLLMGNSQIEHGRFRGEEIRSNCGPDLGTGLQVVGIEACDRGGFGQFQGHRSSSLTLRRPKSSWDLRQPDRRHRELRPVQHAASESRPGQLRPIETSG